MLTLALGSEGFPAPIKPRGGRPNVWPALMLLLLRGIRRRVRHILLLGLGTVRIRDKRLRLRTDHLGCHHAAVIVGGARPSPLAWGLKVALQRGTGMIHSRGSLDHRMVARPGPIRTIWRVLKHSPWSVPVHPFNAVNT